MQVEERGNVKNEQTVEDMASLLTELERENQQLQNQLSGGELILNGSDLPDESTGKKKRGHRDKRSRRRNNGKECHESSPKRDSRSRPLPVTRQEACEDTRMRRSHRRRHGKNEKHRARDRWAMLRERRRAAIQRTNEMVRELERHQIIPSLRTKQVLARIKNVDRIGYGFGGWQCPLAVMIRVISISWDLAVLLDAFDGQLRCENRGQNCSRVSIASLLEQGTTSLHPAHNNFMSTSDGDTTTTVCSDDSGCIHPDRIYSGFLMLLVMGVLGLVLLLDGVFNRPQLRHGGPKANVTSISELAFVVFFTYMSSIMHWTLSFRATTAFHHLQLLHEQGDSASEFDPDIAAAYAVNGLRFELAAAILLTLAMGGQLRAAMTQKSNSKAARKIDTSVLAERRQQSWILLISWLFMLAGALFYRFADSEIFPTLAHALYFVQVTITTVGYGDLTPSKPLTRVFTILYGIVGITLVASSILQLGAVLVTASEAPTTWLLRHVVVKLVSPQLGSVRYSAHSLCFDGCFVFTSNDAAVPRDICRSLAWCVEATLPAKGSRSCRCAAANGLGR